MARIRPAVLMLTLTFAALAVACSSGGDAGDATSTPVVSDPLTTIATVEGTKPPEPGSSPPPAVTVAAGDGAAASMRVGTYCWSGVCADAIGIITPTTAFAAASGDDLTFAGPAIDESRSVTTLQLSPLPDEPVSEGTDWQAWHPTETATALAVTDARATLPADLAPGRYLLSLSLSFAAGGDASYGLVLDIES